MARYIASVCKICRREGAKMFLKGDRCYSDKCSFDKRPYPSGQHGKDGFRKKTTVYGQHLREKQKVKRLYGLMERQFSSYYEMAGKMKGVTGENLLRMLECRLDNIVYRLNFSPSRPAARQLVNHGHFTVNGRTVNIPSYIVKQGDVIEIKENSRGKDFFKISMEFAKQKGTQEWLEIEPDKFRGSIKRLPSREEMPQDIKENLIVEFYSR